jgi:hypothetical protein
VANIGKYLPGSADGVLLILGAVFVLIVSLLVSLSLLTTATNGYINR